MRWLGWGALAGMALAAVLTYSDYQRFLATPLPLAPSGLVLELAPGSGIRQLTQQLTQQAGLSGRGWYLELYARLHGLAPRLQAGEYALTPGTTPRQLLEQIAAGRVVQYALTVVEGWTFAQLLQALAAHPKLQHTLTGLSAAQIMERLGVAEGDAEGWFLPDTYHFPKGFSDAAFLRRSRHAMEQALANAWQQRSADLPLRDAYQLLILASIIEKETAINAERAQISGVFIRRLRLGMRLQTDPTVIYGLGAAFDGNLRRRDLEQDTPYNTYTRSGLPPTPIALPGRAALQAAAQPAVGDSLYFVADGNGGHIFSRSLEEHNRAVRRYWQGREN